MAKRPPTAEAVKNARWTSNITTTPPLHEHPVMPPDDQLRRIVPPRLSAETVGNPRNVLVGFLAVLDPLLSFIILRSKYNFLCTVVTSRLSMHRFCSLLQCRWPHKPCQKTYPWPTCLKLWPSDSDHGCLPSWRRWIVTSKNLLRTEGGSVTI